MGEILSFELTPEQFGIFWKYIEMPSVTDIDYNGTELWITDFERGRYRASEELTPAFINAFTHNIANSVNKQFNNANKILEADTKELRISIIHESVATSGISICIRKSPCVIRNSIADMIDNEFCRPEILQLLINCVLARMNFVFAGEPGAGKTECAKFFMQFIPKEDRVITIEDSLELHYAELNPGADAVELRVCDGFTYTDAIKTCLRQNPKWLILSEARSTEVTSLLESWSTGVNGFTSIHLDDLRKLPDRISNMMESVLDADRMEDRIYRYVNVGILIRCVRTPEGKLHRYIDQLCFYSREQEENKIYMLIKNGVVVSAQLPSDVILRFYHAGIKKVFGCEHERWKDYENGIKAVEKDKKNTQKEEAQKEEEGGTREKGKNELQKEAADADEKEASDYEKEMRSLFFGESGKWQKDEEKVEREGGEVSGYFEQEGEERAGEYTETGEENWWME